MKYLLTLAFLTVLSGCSTPYLYSLTGKSEAQFDRDHYECERDMRTAAHSFSPYDNSPREFHHRCMTAKGYAQHK
jgi:hypothetical protein